MNNTKLALQIFAYLLEHKGCENASTSADMVGPVKLGVGFRGHIDCQDMAKFLSKRKYKDE